MALLSELVRIIAEVEGLEEVSVGIFARHAREAGFISQGGRGRSAAQMTFTDAANLLIAVNGCSLAKEISDKIPIFRASLTDGDDLEDAMQLGRKGASFGDDLELMLQLYSTNAGLELIGHSWISFVKPYPSAHISYYRPDGWKAVKVEHHYANASTYENLLGPDRADETIISDRTIRKVSAAIIS